MSSPPDKYVVMPKIGTHPAKRVKMTVGYEISKCAGTGKPFCKEYFEVYVSKLNVSESRPFGVRNYMYVTTLNGTSSNSSEAWVDMENKYFLKIAFRDQGSCGAIWSLHLSYLTCTVKAENLVKFVKTPAPASSNIIITGKCKDNSIPALPTATLTTVCFVNGTTSTNAKCICNEGYEMKQAACKGRYALYFQLSEAVFYIELLN